jgi:hypothetical protein
LVRAARRRDRDGPESATSADGDRDLDRLSGQPQALADD